MDIEIVLEKHKTPTLIKYKEVFDENDSDLLFSYLLCKNDFNWRSYVVDHNFSYEKNKKKEPVKNEPEKGKSKKDESESESDFANSESSNEPDTKKIIHVIDKEQETAYEIISFADSVWCYRKYFGVVIEKYLIKKHREIFSIIERRLADVIDDLSSDKYEDCKKNLPHNNKYPSYWLCINFRDGFDHLSLSNIVRFYITENPAIMICLGEPRDIIIDDSVESSMDNGSVFVIFSMKNKLEIPEDVGRRCHVCMIGFYSSFAN